MKITKFKSQNNLHHAVAKVLIDQVIKSPKSVLGLATGKTFRPIYAEVVQCAIELKTSFSKVTTFNLDEYLNVDFKESHSFHFYMQENLFSKLDFNCEKTYFPALPGEYFEQLIKSSGGIDLQFLGLGINGHIGFNEPGSNFDSLTRKVVLSEATKNQNRLDFCNGPVPDEAVTMGLATITSAKRCLLVVTGQNKAQILDECLKDVRELFPASLLLNHPNCELFVDESAFSIAKKRGQIFLQGD